MRNAKISEVFLNTQLITVRLALSQILILCLLRQQSSGFHNYCQVFLLKTADFVDVKCRIFVFFNFAIKTKSRSFAFRSEFMIQLLKFTDDRAMTCRLL